MDEQLKYLLKQYIDDPEDANRNYALGMKYYSMGHTASAFSYLLRAAERTDSSQIAYECLCTLGLCFEIQGGRQGSARVMFKHAISLMPNRPEAYFLLSRSYEKHGEYVDAYTTASIGLEIVNSEKYFDIDLLKMKVQYPGKYGLIFEKAVSAWWWGKWEESIDLFKDLWLHYDMDETHTNAVRANLERLNPSVLEYRGFDWGDNPENMNKIIQEEIFRDKIYQKHFDVKEGDIVVDIGANVGAFAYSIRDKKPKHVYCIEPSTSLVKTIKKNLKDIPSTIIDRAISDIDSDCVQIQKDNYIYSHEEDTMKTIRFKTFLDNNKIDRINFLKIDCEGGEYDIFNKENQDFLLNKVDYIVGEWHFNGIPNFLEKFSKFRDLYLRSHNDYHVYERCGKEISDKIFDDEYLIGFEKWYGQNGDGQLLIYINNTTQQPKMILPFASISENVKKKVWVVDDFYSDPHAVREFALEQEYVEGGFGRGFIGRRTEKQFLFDGLKQKFEEIIGEKIGRWEDHGMNGRFQIAWSGEPLVYHCDNQKWAGMLYLTPDAPYQCGTTLYAHKKTRARSYHDEGWDAAWTNVPGDSHLDGTHFEPVDVMGNVFNRLVIFDASAIHSASQYFGTVKENARLWQMFFFD